MYRHIFLYVCGENTYKCIDKEKEERVEEEKKDRKC